MNDLRVSIERLYTVFAAYPLRERIDACPCCQGPQSTRPLHQNPLRALTAEDLHNYAFRAMTTIGDADDFRHFLPRIMELLASPEFLEMPDQQVVLSKLSRGRWMDWPETERDASRHFLRRLWAHVCIQAPDPDDTFSPIGDWLCRIARAESDIMPYLDAWKHDPSSEAAANLERFITGHQSALSGLESPSAYWEDSMRR